MPQERSHSCSRGLIFSIVDEMGNTGGKVRCGKETTTLHHNAVGRDGTSPTWCTATLALRDNVFICPTDSKSMSIGSECQNQLLDASSLSYDCVFDL